ncbi:putative DNA-directed RNA polymerase subunit [Cotonvirus japonicus]|uniref:DNA-directed RNA polymerase subunit n=1 Tax=Cotonvirus japonicus TaxID=2811091 RepID=A0ABM7NSQ6_9VIRU|nr:putative DNA-directed RNA polymerase subunit [Cotonvirus japonicus]BCS83179.1 putative DNA-directed RNA polymerase subunit [Cotonvirus japonicus]
MAQQNLYYQTELQDSVSLLPNQMDSNIDEYLLKNLEAKVKGKITKDGIVLKINRIIDYDNGIITKTNFAGTAVYNVSYECLICSPTKNLSVICVVENIIKGYIICVNGPVIIAILFNNIDTQKFKLDNGNVVYLHNEKPIEKGDYVKVSIINIKNNLNEKRITAISKLLDLASNDEIKLFKEDQIIAVNGEINTNKEFI